ncbi:MAG: MFS transporter [Phycisphaerae bacterium]|nr:MFS transporter [Phycisphaerae bacterium]
MNNEKQTLDAPPFYSKWANTPFAPAKCPFFYGWVIVAVSTISIIFSMPGQTAGIGIFTDYILAALDITRNQLSLAYMIGTITSGLILPFAGKILDRIGVRFMSAFASIGLALSLLIFANVGTINTFLSSKFKVAWLAMIIVSFAFFLVRFFGQGNMTMVGRVAMGRWFNNWRGMATAIAGIPIAFSFNAAPWLLNKLINSFGWQGACYIMAGIVGIVMTLIGMLLFRDNPEECGLTMDGLTESTSQQNSRKQLHTVHRQFTRPQALRSLSFWAFVLGLAAHGLIVTAIAFHITSIGQEMEKTREQAVLMFFYSSFIAIPARFVISFIVDYTRFRLRYVLMMLAATIACYTLGLAWFNTSTGWIVTTIGFGLAGGTWGVLSNVTFPRYFGRKHLGAISGVYMSALVIASAIGPAYFSYGKMLLGSYRNAALSTLVLPVIILILALFTRNPQKISRAAS